MKQLMMYLLTDIYSDVSRDFLRIPFSAGDFEAGAQKGIIVNFEE